MFFATSLPARAIECGALKQLPGADTTICRSDNLTPSIQDLANVIANYLAGILATVILLVIIVSGVQIAASAGNPDAIKTAKNHITNAVISLILLISMYAILRLIGIVK